MKSRLLTGLFLAALLVLLQFAQLHPTATAMNDGAVRLVPAYHVTLYNLVRGCGGEPSSAYVITNLGSAPATTAHIFTRSDGITVYMLDATIPLGGQWRVYLGTLPLPCGTYTVEISADQPISGETVVAYSMEGLIALINRLPPNALAPELANSLRQKVSRSENQASIGNAGTAINILAAFQNEVEAQRGKAIADDTATLLINYSNHLIAQL